MLSTTNRRTRRRSNAVGDWAATTLYVVGFVCILAVTFGHGLLTNDTDAVRVARNAGLTDIEVTSSHKLLPQLRGCGKEDRAAFKITATNPAGSPVQATVCLGRFFKGDTIRY